MNKRYTLDWLSKKDLENLMRGLQLLTELNNAKGLDVGATAAFYTYIGALEAWNKLIEIYWTNN